MAKFLEGNGLTHLWNKIKSYITSWKSENFGTGTYSNSGNINLSSASLDLAYAQIEFVDGNHVYVTRKKGFIMDNQHHNKADNTITMYNNTDVTIYYWL